MRMILNLLKPDALKCIKRNIMFSNSWLIYIWSVLRFNFSLSHFFWLVFQSPFVLLILCSLSSSLTHSSRHSISRCCIIPMFFKGISSILPWLLSRAVSFLGPAWTLTVVLLSGTKYGYPPSPWGFNSSNWPEILDRESLERPPVPPIVKMLWLLVFWLVEGFVRPREEPRREKTTRSRGP